jgi:cytochrome P450
VRTLLLVLSHPEAHRRVLAELGSPVPESAAALDGLPFLDACLTEAAHLYPPVTRTFHHTTAPLSAAGVGVPSDVELATAFPLLGESADAPRFRPDRWLPSAQPNDSSFDPFLGGTRRCPGRNVISFVCKAALAELLVTHRTALASPPLSPEALPPELPSRGLHFRSSPST